MEKDYIDELTKWFDLVKRDFPWRETRSAYTVLISEVMLQQTKAATVIPYFYAWMKKFPDFSSLAEATEEEVVKAWEGLGYYSRARNLRIVAKSVVNDFGGIFPDDFQEILSFKGIGPYTAAAISHFVFNKRVLGVDGNIAKVMARFYGHKERLDKRSAIIPLLDSFLKEDACADSFEALIELGATLCGKKPKCEMCPLQNECIANQENLTDVIPVLKKREKIIPLSRIVIVIEQEDHILIRKEEKNLMKGLYELPFSEFLLADSVEEHLRRWGKDFGAALKVVEELEEVTHTFTKYKASLKPFLCKPLSVMDSPPGFVFVKRSELKKYPFSAGHRKILSLAKKS